MGTRTALALKESVWAPHDVAVLPGPGDAIRPFILHAHGGLYMDVDVECFDATTAMVDGFDLVLQLEDAGNKSLNNAVMAGAPGLGLWAAMQHLLAERCARSLLLTSPGQAHGLCLLPHRPLRRLLPGPCTARASMTPAPWASRPPDAPPIMSAPYPTSDLLHACMQALPRQQRVGCGAGGCVAGMALQIRESKHPGCCVRPMYSRLGARAGRRRCWRCTAGRARSAT